MEYTAKAFCVALHLIFSGLVAAQGDIELSVSPEGELRELDNVTFRCRAAGRKSLDLVRFVRVVNKIEHEIATNDLVAEQYRKTDRYEVTTWVGSEGLMELTIFGVLGQDGGDIGCKKLPPGYAVFTNIFIYVPPRRVELRYHQEEGGASAPVSSPEGDYISLQAGRRAILTCTVVVEGSDTWSDVTITLDSADVTSRFAQHKKRLRDVDQGLLVIKLTSELTARWDDVDVTLALHGANLTCAAVMPRWEPVLASAFIFINQKPAPNCSAEWVMRPDGKYFELSCVSSMHPAPHTVRWAWRDQLSRSLEILDGYISNRTLKAWYLASQISHTGGEFEFVLQFSQIESTDFGQYHLEVTNTEGVGTAAIELNEALVGLTRPEELMNLTVKGQLPVFYVEPSTEEPVTEAALPVSLGAGQGPRPLAACLLAAPLLLLLQLLARDRDDA